MQNTTQIWKIPRGKNPNGLLKHPVNSLSLRSKSKVWSCNFPFFVLPLNLFNACCTPLPPFQKYLVEGNDMTQQPLLNNWFLPSDKISDVFVWRGVQVQNQIRHRPRDLSMILPSLHGPVLHCVCPRSRQWQKKWSTRLPNYRERHCAKWNLKQ